MIDDILPFLNMIEEQERHNQEKEEEEAKKKPSLTEDLGNGVILQLVEIPSGKLPSFLMGKYPVTQAQWRAIMGNSPSNFKGDNRPVESVTWHDAQAFCQELSAKTGRQYRLPSEGEWEYAARGGNDQDCYFFGSSDNQLGDYAWYSKNSGDQTHNVGEKKPNPFGLYDILGNVWEWCQDDWNYLYNYTTINVSPIITNSNIKLLRGGSWGLYSSDCRCDSRYGSYADYKVDYHGFRVFLRTNTL